jgi:hypothetical protein
MDILTRSLVILTTALTFSLGLGFPVSGPQDSLAQDALTAVTIGQFMQGLHDVIQQLETSAHSLIDQGNIALGQQQMLLAGILQQTLDKVGSTYAKALNTTFGQLSVAEQNSFSQLYETINKMKDLEAHTASDVQAIVYQTQGAANQLLDRLPFVDKYPVFFGAAVRDLTLNPDQQPSDIELLGFHWTDPKISKNPVISVGGDLVPPNLVSVREDRVEVQIPDSTKHKIGFGNLPCDPRKTFPISIKVFDTEAKGFWPIQWSSEREFDFNANALPGAQLFDVKVGYSGTRSTQALQAVSYSQKSGWIGAGCEETNNASVRYEAPAGATEIQCAAAWVDTAGVKSVSQNCAVGGAIITAAGSITGRDRQCLPGIGGLFGRKSTCNCPGGAHGWLQVAGSFKVPMTTTEQIHNASVGEYALREGSSASVTLPFDSTVVLASVAINISKKQCPTEYDRIDINAPGNPVQQVNQNSENGFFSSTLWNNQLTVFNVR